MIFSLITINIVIPNLVTILRNIFVSFTCEFDLFFYKKMELKPILELSLLQTKISTM